MKNGMVQNSSFPRHKPCPSTGIPEIPILPTFAPAKSTCRCAYCRLIGGCSRSRTGATCNRVLASGARPRCGLLFQNQGFLQRPNAIYARDQSGAHWWNIKEQIEDYQFVNSRSQEMSRDHLVDTPNYFNEGVKCQVRKKICKLHQLSSTCRWVFHVIRDWLTLYGCFRK